MRTRFGGEKLKEGDYEETKRLLQNDIKVDLEETELEGMEWIDLPQDWDKLWVFWNAVRSFQVA